MAEWGRPLFVGFWFVLKPVVWYVSVFIPRKLRCWMIFSDMLWTKCSGRGLCQRCERWWGSRSCFLLTNRSRCQNRCVFLIQVVVGYMSSIWYRQIRHSGNAKSTCGIAVNALLISILIFKCRWILFLQEMATVIVLEADALSLPAGQMYTSICYTLDTHFLSSQQ